MMLKTPLQKKLLPRSWRLKRVRCETLPPYIDIDYLTGAGLVTFRGGWGRFVVRSLWHNSDFYIERLKLWCTYHILSQREGMLLLLPSLLPPSGSRQDLFGRCRAPLQDVFRTGSSSRSTCVGLDLTNTDRVSFGQSILSGVDELGMRAHIFTLRAGTVASVASRLHTKILCAVLSARRGHPRSARKTAILYPLSLVLPRSRVYTYIDVRT